MLQIFFYFIIEKITNSYKLQEKILMNSIRKNIFLFHHYKNGRRIKRFIARFFFLLIICPITNIKAKIKIIMYYYNTYIKKIAI
jgi:hypothetical protein